MTLLAMTTATILSLSLAPPPPPPLGWESEITEGFEPPIEEVLVDHYYADDDQRDAHAEAWGGEAVPVLQRLYADPKWEEYRPVIRIYLDRYDAPTVAEGIMERLWQVLQDFEPHERHQFESLDTAIRDAWREDPDETHAIVLRAFADAEEVRQEAILRWMQFPAGREGIDMLAEFREAAASERIRDRITARIHAREASERVREPIAWIVERERREEGP